MDCKQNYKRFFKSLSDLRLPYVRNLPDMSGISMLKFVYRNDCLNVLMSGFLTVSEDLIC